MPTVVGRRGFGRRGWGSGPYGKVVPAGGVGAEVDPKTIQRLRRQQQLVQIIKDDEEISALIMLATMRGS
jgi:hypothetical protein|tara:strand:+ start:347 stop:556 length:210 start_codon:yes stop_codon:yes gene_type:complete